MAIIQNGEKRRRRYADERPACEVRDDAEQQSTDDDANRNPKHDHQQHTWHTATGIQVNKGKATLTKLLTAVKVKSGTWYSDAYMSQTRNQKRFTASK